MQTRSQSRKQILEVNIYFDEASRFWNANKEKMSNGCYRYVCGEELKNGNFCKKTCSNMMSKCNQHLRCDNL